MQINKTLKGSDVTIAVEGRLDTNTSPALEKELNAVLPSATALKFDFAALNYVSSAGLRVLLMAQKAMNAKHAPMVITNCNADLMDIFDVTGFIDILNIE